MPSETDIAKIELAFASQYGLDLAGIHEDAASLKKLVAIDNPAPVGPGCYTYNGSQAFVPDLETIKFSEV